MHNVVFSAIIKKDTLTVWPVPPYSLKDGIRMRIPKLEDEKKSGNLFRDLEQGVNIYELPAGITADDITEVEIGPRRINL